MPVTIAETVETARACHKAGAGALHAHVRDEEQRHVLDAGRYRELLEEMTLNVPDMEVQITTEAVGRYAPEEQRDLVRALRPKSVSIALKEMLSDGEEDQARRFYHWAEEAGVVVQHILYAAEEQQRLFELCDSDVLPDAPLQLLFVLGATPRIRKARRKTSIHFWRVWRRGAAALRRSTGPSALSARRRHSAWNTPRVMAARRGSGLRTRSGTPTAPSPKTMRSGWRRSQPGSGCDRFRVTRL